MNVSSGDLRLDGRVVLVTGSSRGIGRAVALRCAAAGARVAVNYINDEQAANDVAAALGEKGAGVYKADIGNPEAVRLLIETVIGSAGRIDVLVNNAGIAVPNPFGGDFAEWTRNWRRTLDVNLLGAAAAAFCVIPHMQRQGGGRIVNVASQAAFSGDPEFPDYAVAKAGLVNLTRTLTRRFGRDGIIATCVAPGWTDTDLAAPYLEGRREEAESITAVGRIASPESVANVVAFLASDMATDLAGITIDINGGAYFH